MLGQAEASNRLGWSLYNQGRFYEAIEEFNKAIAIDPNFSAPHNGLGNIFRAQKLFDEAIIEYCKAVTLDPRYAVGHQNLIDTIAQEAASK